MTTYETGTVCGLPLIMVGNPRNDTVAYINDILLAVVNGSFSTFAFCSNLAIIVAVVKNPSLQKPCNILLCSLASADCLTGITSQPMFVAWRFFLKKAQRSCLHQVLIFEIYHTFNVFTVGLSFTNVVLISFDRLFALSRPLVYRADATNQGAMKTALLASTSWLLFTVLVKFVLPYNTQAIAYFLVTMWLMITPVVNHVRMLFAIRHHNRQMGDAVSTLQMSVVLRREKKVALDMFVVMIVLLASNLPIFFMERAFLRYPRVHAIMVPWVFTVAFISSSFNPLYYFARNANIRNAVKSMINILKC